MTGNFRVRVVCDEYPPPQHARILVSVPPHWAVIKTSSLSGDYNHDLSTSETRLPLEPGFTADNYKSIERIPIYRNP